MADHRLTHSFSFLIVPALLCRLALLNTPAMAQEQIFNAISADDMPMLREAVERNPDWLESIDWSGASPLHSAVFLGRKEAVRFLVELGCKLDTYPTEKATPLLNTAALAGVHDTMRYLIEKGARVNDADPLGVTPLHCAIGSYDLEMVRILLKAGASLEAREHLHGRTALHQAASGWALTGAPKGSRNDLLAIVQALVDAGADTKATTWDGKTSLQLAEESNQREVADYLRTLGVPEQGPTEYPTQIVAAMSAGDLSTVKKLLERFPEARVLRIEDPQKYPNIPYSLAAQAVQLKSPGLLKLLLENGVSPSAVHPGSDGNLCQPIHYAAKLGSVEMVQLLLKHGADINARDYRRRTPLHYAVYGYSPEMVKLLLDKGAEVNAVDSNNQTPFTAADSGGGTIARLLKEHGGTDAPAQSVQRPRREETCTKEQLEALHKDLLEALNRRDVDAVAKLTVASDPARVVPLIKEVAAQLPALGEFVKSARLVYRGDAPFYSIVVDDAGRMNLDHKYTLFDLLPLRKQDGTWGFSGLERACLFIKARGQIQAFLKQVADALSAGNIEALLPHFTEESRSTAREQLEAARKDFAGIAALMKNAGIRRQTENSDGREGTAEVGVPRGKAALVLGLKKDGGTWRIESTGGLLVYGEQMRAMNRVFSRLADVLSRTAFDEAAEIIDPDLFPSLKQSWEQHPKETASFSALLKKATPTFLGISEPNSGYASFELPGTPPLEVSLERQQGQWRIKQFPAPADFGDEPERIRKLIDGMVAACNRKDPKAAQEFFVPPARGEMFMVMKQHPEVLPALAKSLSAATIKHLGPEQQERGLLPVKVRRGELEMPSPDGKMRVPVSIMKINDEWFLERL